MSKLSLTNPMDWYVILIAYFCNAVMWLWIAASPVILFSLIGLFLFGAFQEFGFYLMLGNIFFGVVLGIVWAERIRKNIGCIEFMGKLLSTPEIEGWRTKKQHKRVY